MSLSVGPSLSSAVAANHILIELLGDIQIRHTNQVTAVLRAEVQDKKTVRSEQIGEKIFVAVSPRLTPRQTMPRARPAASEYDSLSVQYSISGPGGRPEGETAQPGNTRQKQTQVRISQITS